MAAGSIASVTVSNVTDTSFKLTWPAATGGDTTTGYNVFIPSSTYRSSNVVNNGDGTHSYTFTTITSGGAALTPGTTYTWGVEANSATGVGPRYTGSATTTGGSGGSNIAPTANAGSDQSVIVGATVTVTGSGTDPDGTINSYLWTLTTKPSGSTATLSGSGNVRTFTADLTGTYVASLVVTDNGGASSPADTVTVTAATGTGNLAIPSVAVTDIGMTSFRITWAAADGTPSGYNVFRPSGSYLTSVGASTYTYVFTGLTAATAYTWGVEATSAGGGGPRFTGTTTTASSQPAPPDITAEAPGATMWDDPIPLTLAPSSTYSTLVWSVTSAPAGSTATVTGISPASFVPDKAGTYVFTATATSAGGTDTSSVTVKVGATLYRKGASGLLPTKTLRKE